MKLAGIALLAIALLSGCVQGYQEIKIEDIRGNYTGVAKLAKYKLALDTDGSLRASCGKERGDFCDRGSWKLLAPDQAEANGKKERKIFISIESCLNCSPISGNYAVIRMGYFDEVWLVQAQDMKPAFQRK